MSYSEMIKLLKTISYQEDEGAIKLIPKYSSLKKKGYLTKFELIEILAWKSKRNIHGISNSEAEINEITKLAFSVNNDALKAHILTALIGVRIPSASAILMFYDPIKYPVIDTIVWKKLMKVKLVHTNEKGVNFTLNNWITYLELIRKLAKKLNMTARQVEKRLYDDKSIKI